VLRVIHNMFVIRIWLDCCRA